MGMGFGEALTELGKGRRVARRGWNGKDMWLLRVEGNQYALKDVAQVDELELLPWIGLKTATGGFVPWLASQSDVLASDWQVVS